LRWFALAALLCAACARSQGFRPAAASSSPGRTQEFGLALSSVEPRRYVNEKTQRLGQAWWTVQLRERWALSTIAGFDTSSALGGAALRWDGLRARWVNVSGELELGLFWAAASVPASLRLWPGAQLYTAPRLGSWGSQLTPFLPLGLSAEIVGATIVRAEAQVSWSDFQYYNRRVHWGLALAHQW
jgi:hypothetical protein